MSRKVAIIVLNYNNFEDTKNCILSLLKLNNNSFDIFLIDNKSIDNSATLLEKFTTELADVRLHYFENSVNNGFAGGNNYGINKAQSIANYQYFWILNNDTLVYPETLNLLLDYSLNNPSKKIIGNTLVYYDNPQIIQSLGAGFNYYLALGYNLADGQVLSEISHIPNSEYPVGASIFCTSEYIEKVGLMNEEYFLYYEEIDWIERGKLVYKDNFYGFCKDAIVIHKEGASIGTSKQSKSILSDFFFIRNRILFTRNYYKKYFLFVLIGISFSFFKRLFKLEFKNCLMILRILLNPSRNPYLK